MSLSSSFNSCCDRSNNALKEELSDKFVFLKMNGCIRHKVNHLAISMLDSKTLAVRDTQAPHSSEFLRQTLETILKEFDLKNSRF